VRLAGKADLADVPAVLAAGREALAGSAGQRLVMDLREVTFMDSAGVGALVSLVKAARASGRSCTVWVRTPAVVRTLSVMGLMRAFDVHIVSTCDPTPSDVEPYLVQARLVATVGHSRSSGVASTTCVMNAIDTWAPRVAAVKSFARLDLGRHHRGQPRRTSSWPRAGVQLSQASIEALHRL